MGSNFRKQLKLIEVIKMGYHLIGLVVLKEEREREREIFLDTCTHRGGRRRTVIAEVPPVTVSVTP